MYGLGYLKTNTLCLGFGEEKRIDPKHKFTFTGLRTCDREKQDGAQIMGLTTGPVSVVRNCVCNLHNGYCNRHLTEQPEHTLDIDPAYKWLKEYSLATFSMYQDMLPTIENSWLARWSRKQRNIIEASIENDPIMPDRVTGFTKRELYAYLDHEKEPTKGRNIQCFVNKHSQFASAYAVTAAQKTASGIFGLESSIVNGVRACVASGMKSQDLGKWLQRTLDRFPNAHFYERDGANWDATMHHSLFKFEYAFYKYCGMDSTSFGYVKKCENVKFRVRPRGEGDWEISGRSFGTRKSGHNTTTVGNCLINIGIVVDVCLRLGLQAEIIVAGDDLIVAFPDKIDARKFADLESRYGIVPEYRLFSDWRDISFISGQWYPSGDPNCPYFFGPKPGRLLRRLFWTTKHLPVKQRAAWVAAVVLGMASVCNHIPIIREWNRTTLRNAGPVTHRLTVGLDKYLETYKLEGVRVNDEVVMQDFLERYSLSRDDVQRVEQIIKSVTLPTALVVDPILDVLEERDLVGVDVRPTVGISQ